MFVRRVCSLALLLVLLAFSSVSPAMSEESQPLRVLPLGDSITAGVGANGINAEDGGYRGTLAQLLTQNGYRVQFVGTRTDYSAKIVNRAHDGWPGYVLRSFAADPGPGQLYGAIAQRALESTHPDVVLLMAGTNDLLRLERRVPGYTLGNVLKSMDLLLGEIFAVQPGVRVIVAPVVESPRISADTIAAFNGNLRPIVEGYAKRGNHVELVTEMQDAVPRDVAHFPDGIHPCADGGYADVAQVWYRALQRLTGPSPDKPIAKQ